MSRSHHLCGPDWRPVGNTNATRAVVTDLTINFCTLPEAEAEFARDSSVSKWRRINKDLYLHSTPQNAVAWLLVAEAQEGELKSDDLVVTDIRTGEICPCDKHDGSSSSEKYPTATLKTTTTRKSWESRPGGIQVARTKYSDIIHHGQCKGDSQAQSPAALPVTGVDVLFGVDAVDPRPHWTLLEHPLQLPDVKPDVPVPRLTVQHSPSNKDPREPVTPPWEPLRAREDGTFKIVQISDTHMVTGPGVCDDAVDANGKPLPRQVADPLSIAFLGGILDLEKPDLVILTGDQLHHDIPDSQSALLKVVSPLIARQIPFAAVFGNHDSEGAYALSREAQMSILEDLPFSLCQPGPDDVEGVGNYYLSVLPHSGNEGSGSEAGVATLYLVDSHGQIPSDVKNPDYDAIQQSQIDWFTNTSQSLRRARMGGRSENRDGPPHLSLVFIHIPLPEYEDDKLVTTGGLRREPTEGPSFNSHFYDALSEEGVLAVSCGHDHVNDFCGVLPGESNGDQSSAAQLGPWLCYGGGSGFGGYCSYGENRYYRRARVWELETGKGGIKTWKRVEYTPDRVDELLLVEGGSVVDPRASLDTRKGPFRTVGQAEL
ncbi:hypothetical protein KVR01_011557 [Diaporthe batatas]|uniref:uncharacterized protein n=1 Tax=Diaporthe batatas TaxID=748121 RepID=UPI001D03FC01|nr:uncharacterized protein KVR01_011557 [Diaporthe batatas]KAG8158435.1 hypothetical protein KVR01_011557 [Diaporthe batatas]